MASRAAEQQRQQRSRASRSGSRPATVRMSRATLGPEVAAVFGECLEKLDQSFRQSRATFERALVGTLIRMFASSEAKAAANGASTASQGQAGP